MSGLDTARRTDAELSFAGVDITDAIMKYLLSITYTDNEEDEADDLQITLQDRDGIWLTKWLGDIIDSAASSGGGQTAQGRPTLRSGSRGQDVRDMQAALVGRGHALPLYGADGIFGYETETALLAFQEANALDADGVCGPRTWVALLGASTGAGASGTGFRIGATIITRNWDADGRDRMLDCGTFELDAVTAEGPPGVITIKGTTLPYGTGVRQTSKSRAWESTRLSALAKQIATNGGLGFLYESPHDPFYKRVEQSRKDDINFLSGLCHDAGISLKVADNVLVLFDQREYESKPPVLDIEKGGGKYTKWRLMTGEHDTNYDSCRVSYVDPVSGKKIEGVTEAGDETVENGKRLEVTAKVDSAEEARALAGKRLRLANKLSLTAQFTLPGDPGLMAGLTVTLTGWGAWGGKYIISQAQHMVGNAGYTTQIALRRVLEGY